VDGGGKRGLRISALAAMTSPLLWQGLAMADFPREGPSPRRSGLDAATQTWTWSTKSLVGIGMRTSYSVTTTEKGLRGNATQPQVLMLAKDKSDRATSQPPAGRAQAEGSKPNRTGDRNGL
jgi:hypothetical protein